MQSQQQQQQQQSMLPLLNHNNYVRENNAPKWDEDDFAELLGCVARI